MTPEAAVTELIKEIRADRVASMLERKERKVQFDRIEARLTTLERAVVELGKEIQAVREGAGEEGASIRKHLRMVAAHAGVIDPDGNGR